MIGAAGCTLMVGAARCTLKDGAAGCSLTIGAVGCTLMVGAAMCTLMVKAAGYGLVGAEGVLQLRPRSSGFALTACTMAHGSGFTLAVYANWALT
jgi:hypothetical protein